MSVQLHELLAGLNEPQIQAVTHGEGPALVLAGPGSGKTTVIVKRILYLIQIQKIPPEEILVLTFTRDAAQSMKNRFEKLITDDLTGMYKGMTVPVNFGTFHSVFYHILMQAHGSNSKTILSAACKNEIMTEILKDRAVRRQEYYEFDFLKGLVEDYLAAVSFYKNTYDMVRTLQMLPADYREDFGEIFQRYQRKCKLEGGLDFDDMVFACRELLVHDDCRRNDWQMRFSYILVDEFQDINPMQYEVVKLLGAKHGNIFVVGDEDQAIYGFRGSNPECMKKFAEEYHAKQIFLNANYRSTTEIVTLAEQVIAESKKRIISNKNVYAAGNNANLQESIHFLSFESKQQEISYLADQLKGFWENNKTGFGENCGVLFRTNRAMQRMAVVLSKQGIPFFMKEKGANPYEHFIVKDIMAYLKLAAGDRSRKNFLRIMNRPVRYLSRECVGENTQIDLEHLCENKQGASQQLNKLYKQLKQLSEMPLTLAIHYICKVIGYEAYLGMRKEAEEHLEEWRDVLDFCKADAGNYKNITDWENAQRRFGSGNFNPNYVRKEADACIWLMTVHASKGLEFDRVYLPDCNEKVYPHGNLQDHETIEEERRIFYVGITRAQKRLELLCTIGTKERPRQISRFLNPVIHQLSRQTRNYPDIHQMHP